MGKRADAPLYCENGTYRRLKQPQKIAQTIKKHKKKLRGSIKNCNFAPAYRIRSLLTPEEVSGINKSQYQ